MHDAEQTPFSSVIGTVSFCVPYLGFVNAYCTTMPGLLVVVAVLALLIAASIVLDRMVPDEPAGKHTRVQCEGAAFIAAGKSVGGGRGRCRGKRFSKGRERWKTKKKKRYGIIAALLLLVLGRRRGYLCMADGYCRPAQRVYDWKNRGSR